MDEVWQEIRTELLKQPPAERAQRVAPYAPFVFRGEVYCRVEYGGVKNARSTKWGTTAAHVTKPLRATSATSRCSRPSTTPCTWRGP